MIDLADHLGVPLAPRYRIERELGRGGMAVVFLAEDLKHQRRVALKVMMPELVPVIGVERFLREIQIAASLTHPNILPLHDSGEAAGLLYYVMPYVEGETLRERLNRESQLPVEAALAIVREVADAINHAHQRGVVHRDIKPENILFAAGHALVSDFGIARAIDAASSKHVTENGFVVGTPAYMSPEQATGAPSLDGRSDVYSLGCLAYEMLGGQPPFSGPSMQSVLAQHSFSPVPSLRTLRPNLPDGIARAVERALAKSPADRYTSTAAFAEALTHPATAQLPARSIAVLPFLDLGGDPENAYFADGITEDVITQLSRIRTLKVISRTSVMPFKRSSASLREIADRLGVATLLEGSVRRAANRVRIVAQLIDAATDRHLWSETYDRDLTDIFAIQSDVALRIAAALEAELSPDERARLRDHSAGARAPRSEAHEAYLRGRFHWYQHTPESLESASRYFELAVEKDPGYALAHAAVADAWGARMHLGLVTPREAYPVVKAGVLRALGLDDTIPETHDMMGRVRFWTEFDWAGAEQSYRRAIEISANYPDARVFYAVCLFTTKRWDEARAQYQRALELDPLNPFFHWSLGVYLLCRRRYDEAATQFRKALHLEPGEILARLGLWTTLHQYKQGEALAEAVRYFDALGDHEVTNALTQGFAQGGYRNAMRMAADRLAERFSHQYVPPVQIARVYACADERDLALEWLERGLAERDFEMVYLGVHPLWDGLRTDARFEALARRMESVRTDLMETERLNGAAGGAGGVRSEK